MEAQAPTTTLLLRASDAATSPSRRPAGAFVRPRSPAWPWRAWLTIIALPLALLAGLVWRYGVDVPHFDQWVATSPLFEKHAAGTLRLADFFTPNNEHRLVLPKLVFYLLGLLTHWNTRAETAVTLLVLTGISANCWQLLRVSGWRDTPATRGLFGALAAFVFTTVQHDNVLSGFQFHFIVSILFFTAACGLASTLAAPRNFVAAALLCTAATYSIASGCVTWLLAVPVLWSASRGTRWKWWALYGAAGAIMIGLCFAGLERPPNHPSLATVLQQPAQGAAYLLAYLGGPLAHGTSFPAPQAAPWIGAALLLAFLAAATGVWRGRQDRAFLRRALPWAMIACFGLANAAITMIGRLGFGVAQALESRYATYALLLPIGLVPMAALWISRWQAPRRSLGRGLLGTAVGALLLLLALSQLQLFADWAVRRRTMLLERSLVHMARAVHEPQLLRRFVTPNGAAFRGSVEALDGLGFLHPRPLRSARIAEIADPAAASDGAHGRLERHAEYEGQWVATGWAVLPEKMEPTHAVLLTYDDPAQGPVIFAVGAVGIPRPELAAATDCPDYVHAGWAIAFPRTKLPPGSRVVTAWAYDAEAGRAWRLAGEAALAP